MTYIMMAIVAVAVLFACKTAMNKQSEQTKEITSNTKEVTTATNGDMIAKEKMLVFSKGGCFGRCPIYDMTIYSNGYVEYEGKRFTNRLGLHNKKLDSSTMTAIKSACKSANLWDCPDKYETRIPDLPSSEVTYFEDGKEKTVWWKEQADDGVKSLGKILDAIGKDEEGWAIKKGQSLPEYMMANELILNLREDVKAENFAKKYSDYQMEVKEKISPRGNYWTMTYNTDKIEPYIFLNTLNKDEQVINAEFNKKTSQRGH